MSLVGAAEQESSHTVMVGIGLATLSYFLFSFHDATIKWLTQGYGVWQILFVRSLVIVLFCLARGRGPLLRRAATTPRRVALILRGFAILAAWLCYYTAAGELQLAEVVTLYFAAPLLVTLLAVPMLGERVPPSRWLALAIGFAGVLIACNPHDLSKPLPIALALTAALLWAFAMVLLRRMAKTETTALQMLYSNGFFLVATGATMPWFWQAPPLADLLLMVLVGAIGAGAQVALLEGVRRAPASLLAPFEYTALLWSFVLGLAIWGDVPSPTVFAGAGLILASGGLVLWLEHRRRLAA